MAEETDSLDTTVDGAAAAIAELLKGQSGASEAPPEKTEIPPEVPAPQAQASEANTAEEVQAPDSQPTEQQQPAPVQAEPAKQPVPDPQATDKAVQEANAARDQLASKANTLGVLISTLENAVKGEFADIKTQDDLIRLGQTDPERYNRFVLAANQIQQAKAAQESATADLQRGQLAKFQDWQKGEMDKLDKLIPELRDPQKGPGLAKSLHEYALNKMGYSQQQLTMASASDFVVLHKAMQFDKIEEAKTVAAQKAAKAPPVQVPGTVRETGKQEKVQEDFMRLQKTGKLQDAASVMRNYL